MVLMVIKKMIKNNVIIIDVIDNPQTHATHTLYTMIASLRRVRWNRRFSSKISQIPKLDYKYLKSNVESVAENIANRKARGDVRKVAETHGT